MADIITDIEHREGDGAITNDPADAGGRTQYGISEKANPAAWADGKVTEAEARAIYLKKYIEFPKFNLLPSILQPLCIDWGVVSGPQLVVGILQETLQVVVDHVIGPQTLAALPLTPEGLIKLNNLLVLERFKQIGRLVTKDPSQAKYCAGWINRTSEFLL